MTKNRDIQKNSFKVWNAMGKISYKECYVLYVTKMHMIKILMTMNVC